MYSVFKGHSKEYGKNSRDFGGIGYNFLILVDGTVQIGRDLGNWNANHTKGNANYEAIGISWCGGTPNSGKGAEDHRTSQQKQAMHNLVNALKKTYGITRVVGHRNCIAEMASSTWQEPKYSRSSGAKGCPCFDAAAEFGYNPPGKNKPG